MNPASAGLFLIVFGSGVPGSGNYEGGPKPPCCYSITIVST